MEPVLYLVRHGRTELNSNNCFRGAVDVDLSDAGKADAEEAAKFLDSLNIDPVFMVSSDKSRAVETADILKKTFNIPLETTHQLRALNVGKFSGQPRNDENIAELQKYLDDEATQIPGGESLNEFRDRVVPAIEECFKLACKHGVGFVICHSSIVHEVGNQLYGDHNSVVVSPGGIVVVGFEDGKPEAKPIFKKHSPAKDAASIS